jgi:hypothetical protein
MKLFVLSESFLRVQFCCVLWTDATTTVCYWQNHINSRVYLSEDDINTDYTGVTGIMK